MDSVEFPLVLSPNLGCPRIISVEEIEKGETISLIIAGQYGEFTSPVRDAFEGILYLRPSYSEEDDAKDIPLHLTRNPEEMTDWNLLSDFSEAEDSMKIINSELHYNVLGEHTRYWNVEVSVKNDDKSDYYKPLLIGPGWERGQISTCSLVQLYSLMYHLAMRPKGNLDNRP